MKALKTHWLSIMIGVIGLMMFLQGAMGIVDGHIWIGGRSNYKLIEQSKTPLSFWITVVFFILMSALTGKVTQWLWQFEKSMTQQSQPMHPHKKKKGKKAPWPKCHLN